MKKNHKIIDFLNHTCKEYKYIRYSVESDFLDVKWNIPIYMNSDDVYSKLLYIFNKPEYPHFFSVALQNIQTNEYRLIGFTLNLNEGNDKVIQLLISDLEFIISEYHQIFEITSLFK